MLKSARVSLPFYTTRPHFTGDGDQQQTASYSQTFWITILVIWLVELTLILWSCYGLYVLGTLVT